MASILSLIACQRSNDDHYRLNAHVFFFDENLREEMLAPQRQSIGVACQLGIIFHDVNPACATGIRRAEQGQFYCANQSKSAPLTVPEFFFYTILII